jgi:hypothetical protein
MKGSKKINHCRALTLGNNEAKLALKKLNNEDTSFGKNETSKLLQKLCSPHYMLYQPELNGKRPTKSLVSKLNQMPSKTITPEG